MNKSRNDFRLIIPSSADEIETYYRIRYEVLRKPWNQPEHSVRDETEDISIHVLMVLDSGKAVATGRLQINSAEEGQVRSMAVVEEFRGQGLGSVMLNFLEQKAAENKLSRIILDARENAVDFYLKNGYKAAGESYKLFGIIPHTKMIKEL